MEKLTEANFKGKGVSGLPDTPNLSAGEMQAKFDELSKSVLAPKINELIGAVEALQQAQAGHMAQRNNPHQVTAAQLGGFLDVTYPVGSIYLTMSAEDPAVLFGGQWKKLENRFLLGTGKRYDLGETGGETMHLLTLQEMPSHSHKIWQNAAGGSGNMSCQVAPAAAENHVGELTGTTAVGGGNAHNNMPPFLAVNMWQREG